MKKLVTIIIIILVLVFLSACSKYPLKQFSFNDMTFKLDQLHESGYIYESNETSMIIKKVDEVYMVSYKGITYNISGSKHDLDVTFLDGTCSGSTIHFVCQNVSNHSQFESHMDFAYDISQFILTKFHQNEFNLYVFLIGIIFMGLGLFIFKCPDALFFYDKQLSHRPSDLFLMFSKLSGLLMLITGFVLFFDEII